MRVGVLGDIMDIGDHDLAVADCVRDFFADCDVVIGNLEAVIASPKTHPQQNRHHARVLRQLDHLCPASKFCLNVANNHAADFGRAVFNDSVRQISDAGFRVFGTRDRPYVDVGSDLRVIAGSQWTNMPCDFIADLDDMPLHLAADRFHLFYPHWGYELECYPRGEIETLARHLLDQADAIVGHHSHTPQPVRWCRVNGRPKMLATSLGNFCCRHRPFATRSYRFGAMIKFGITRLPSTQTHPPLPLSPSPSRPRHEVTTLHWRFIESTAHASTVQVRIAESIPLHRGKERGSGGMKARRI